MACKWTVDECHRENGFPCKDHLPPAFCECCGAQVEREDNCAPYGTQCEACGICLMFHDSQDGRCCVEDERHTAKALAAAADRSL